MSELYQLDEGFKTMKTMTRMIQLSVLLVAAFSMSAAIACTAGAWNGGVTGNPAIAADPAPDTALPRVSGVCALTLTAAGTVKDESPIVEDEVYIRFYVLGDISSEVVIFEAFSDDNATAGNELITVSYDGTNFVFDAGDGASGPVAGRTGWNMIQLSWLKNDVLAYTVNGGTDDEQAGSVGALGGDMESVILGSTVDPAGTLIFDDYEAHRETPVDGLLIADGNSDDGIDVADIVVARNEALGRALSSGTPDCNLDGAVDVADIVCTRNIALGRN